MSTTSVYGAFKARYNSLDNVPRLYTFDAPVSDAGSQVYPEYAVLIDEGLSPSYEFEHTVMEVTTLLLMVYGDTLDAVDAAVEAIKYNGGSVTAGAGMDFGTLDALDARYTCMEVRRMSEKRFAATATGKSAQRIYGCELQYRVTVYRIA